MLYPTELRAREADCKGASALAPTVKSPTTELAAGAAAEVHDLRAVRKRRPLQRAAGLEGVLRPAAAAQEVRAHAFEAPARFRAVGVRDVDPQERVRVRPIELDDLAFELLVRLHVEHAERMMRLCARGPRRERENADDAAEDQGRVTQRASAGAVRCSHFFSSNVRSMPDLPSSVVKLRLFCWHTYSASVQSR